MLRELCSFYNTLRRSITSIICIESLLKLHITVIFEYASDSDFLDCRLFLRIILLQFTLKKWWLVKTKLKFFTSFFRPQSMLPKAYLRNFSEMRSGNVFVQSLQDFFIASYDICEMNSGCRLVSQAFQKDFHSERHLFKTEKTFDRNKKPAENWEAPSKLFSKRFHQKLYFC